MAGDTQNFGRAIWIAQQETSDTYHLHFIDIESGKIVKDLTLDRFDGRKRPLEYTVCGPHVIQQSTVEKFGGMHLWRIDWNGTAWSLRKHFVAYPAEILEDVPDDSYVDVNVVAETQILFLWRKSSYSCPQAILRDYLLN